MNRIAVLSLLFSLFLVHNLHAQDPTHIHVYTSTKHQWDASGLQEGYSSRLGILMNHSRWLHLQLEGSLTERGYANHLGLGWRVLSTLFPVDYLSAGLRFTRTRSELAHKSLSSLAISTIVREDFFTFEAGSAFLSVADDRELWNSSLGSMQFSFLIQMDFRIRLIQRPHFGWDMHAGFSSHDGFEFMTSEMIRFYLSHKLQLGSRLTLTVEAAAWYSNFFDFAGFWSRHLISVGAGWQLGGLQ